MVAQRKFERHRHDELVHEHDHVHITHHAKGGTVNIEHLMSRHSHTHDHPALEHSHLPHENAEQEHLHEAHVHDHEMPVHGANKVGTPL